MCAHKIPFWMSSALRAADLGFLLRVKCFGNVGCWPTTEWSAILLRYVHSSGRRFEPFSAAATEQNKKNIMWVTNCGYGTTGKWSTVPSPLPIKILLHDMPKGQNSFPLSFSNSSNHSTWLWLCSWSRKTVLWSNTFSFFVITPYDINKNTTIWISWSYDANWPRFYTILHSFTTTIHLTQLI